MLIELPLRISDEIARRLGILAMSRETRDKQLDYLSERWFIQDGRANFVKLILLSKNILRENECTLKYHNVDTKRSTIF